MSRVDCPRKLMAFDLVSYGVFISAKTSEIPFELSASSSSSSMSAAVVLSTSVIDTRRHENPGWRGLGGGELADLFTEGACVGEEQRRVEKRNTTSRSRTAAGIAAQVVVALQAYRCVASIAASFGHHERRNATPTDTARPRRSRCRGSTPKRTTRGRRLRSTRRIQSDAASEQTSWRGGQTKGRRHYGDGREVG